MQRRATLDETPGASTPFMWREWTESHIGSLSDAECIQLEVAFTHFLENRTAELPSSLFSQLHGSLKSRLLGITYTPRVIRQVLTARAIDTALKEYKAEELRISDPCCGSGAFTITALEHLVENGVEPQFALERLLHFSDVDRLSVALSYVNICAWLTARGHHFEEFRINGDCADFLSSNRKFNCFITNPPYVKLQNLSVETRSRLKADYPTLFVGTLGLAPIFLKKMMTLLEDGGVIAVITQNNFFTSNSAVELRRDLAFHVQEIATFGSKKVFDTVSAYACLLYLNAGTQDEFRFRRINCLEDLNGTGERVLNSSLSARKWRLGSKEELRELEAMETRGVPLGTACRIAVGIATLLDKAFFVYAIEGQWVAQDPSGNRSTVEGSIVKPLIKISEIPAQAQTVPATRGVIYPYAMRGSRPTAISEEELGELAPRALSHLYSWKNALRKRDKGKAAEDAWYLWGRQQSMTATGPKLLTKTFSKGPHFVYDASDSLFANGYAVFPRGNDFDLRFVQAVLNSRVFFYYAKQTSFEIDGDYQCYQKNFIEKFCLPILTLEDQCRLTEEPESLEEFLLSHYGISEESLLLLES